MPTATSSVKLFYDSLSRVIEDCQEYGGNTRSVTNEAFISHALTQQAYPNNRQVTSIYDALYRRSEVKNTGGASIAQWQFFGPSRVAEVQLGNGLIQSHLNNARTRGARQSGQSTPGWGDDDSDRLGYDGAGRPITKRFLADGINGTTGAYNDATSLVGFTTEYDRASNKLYERHLHAESRSHLYEPIATSGAVEGGYDSLDRLRQYQRGVLSDGVNPNPAPPGGQVVTPISLPNTDEFRTYDLDGLGNWRRTSFEPVGGSEATQIRQHNGLNQITRLQIGASKTPLTYDKSGNLLNDGTRKYEWDALNRLKKVYKTPTSPVLIGEYQYDALGRRIRKVVSNGGLSGSIPNGTTDFLWTGWQCLEERDGSNSPTKQYVWGLYIDELIEQRDIAGEDDYYPLQDLLYRTTALTDATAAIVEAYDCDAYGNTLIFTAAGTGGDWWADDAVQGDNPTCEFIFTGRRFDSETRLYFYSSRYYSSTGARFISRDRAGYIDGLNLYGFAGSNPQRNVDPTGTFKGDYNLHHVVGEWYCQYSAYGARAQGLRILLTKDFHVQLERLLRPIWMAYRSGQISQWVAYNRSLLVHVRMFPMIIRDTRAAASATGGSWIVWQGGGRAFAAQFGYVTSSRNRSHAGLIFWGK